jgi:hypothetical protein
LCSEHGYVDVVVHLPSAEPTTEDEETMRSISLDIHRRSYEVAIAAGAEIRSPGRIEMTPAA